MAVKPEVKISRPPRMEKGQFRREMLYQVTMCKVRELRKLQIINEEEYRAIEDRFIQKYRPMFGTLFSDFDLL